MVKYNYEQSDKFENINRENHINSVDEREVFLRMKAGSFVYLFVALYLHYFILKHGLQELYQVYSCCKHFQGLFCINI